MTPNLTGVDVMPFKSVQWETGFQYDYSSGAHSITLPTTHYPIPLRYHPLCGTPRRIRWHACFRRREAMGVRRGAIGIGYENQGF